MKSKNKLKKNNHWVPRFYLKEFAIPGTRDNVNPQIWAFHNKEGDPFTTGIKQIAVKKNLYCPKDEKGIRNDEAEDLLNMVESFNSNYWPQIASKMINFESLSIRRPIIVFLVSLYLRNIKQLELVRNLRKTLIDFYEKIPKDSNGNPMVDEIIHSDRTLKIDRSSYKDFINPSYDVDHEMFVESIFQNTFNFANILVKKKWTIIESKNSQFITTDNPVILLNERKINFGLGTEGTLIIFPLSPMFLLMLHDEEHLLDNRYYTTETPEIYNYILWINSYNFMFSHRNIYEVLVEMDYLHKN